MLTFLHAADLHLDSPFRSLSPEQAIERREEQRQLLARLTDAAQQADILLLSGDLFDGQRARPETLRVLYGLLEELDAEVFLSPGNHDPYLDTSPYAKLQWPSHVHIFTKPTLERIELPHLNAVVYGSAFTAPYRMDSPLEGFHAEDEDCYKIGCLHADLTSPNSRYAPITLQQIAASGLDYLALGHIHAASGLKRVGRTYYAWPGCPEGRGFDETGEKGVYLGELDERGVRLEFLPLARRRYLTPSLDITGKNPASVVRDFLHTARPEDILRLTLVGERSPEVEPNLTELTTWLSSYFYSATLYDNTTLSHALWERMQENTLTGLFLRAMRQRLDSATREEIPLLERAIRFGLAALEGREEPR